MNIRESVYNILTIAQADGSLDFRNAEIQNDRNKRLAQITIRTVDLLGFEAIYKDGGIDAQDGVIDVKIYYKPKDQTPDTRQESEIKLQALANEVNKVLWDAADKQGLCEIGRIWQRFVWEIPGNISTPTAILRIQINPS
jgi:hypothetical protein